MQITFRLQKSRWRGDFRRRAEFQMGDIRLLGADDRPAFRLSPMPAKVKSDPASQNPPWKRLPLDANRLAASPGSPVPRTPSKERPGRQTFRDGGASKRLEDGGAMKQSTEEDPPHSAASPPSDPPPFKSAKMSFAANPFLIADAKAKVSSRREVTRHPPSAAVPPPPPPPPPPLPPPLAEATPPPPPPPQPPPLPSEAVQEAVEEVDVVVPLVCGASDRSPSASEALKMSKRRRTGYLRPSAPAEEKAEMADENPKAENPTDAADPRAAMEAAEEGDVEAEPDVGTNTETTAEAEAATAEAEAARAAQKKAAKRIERQELDARIDAAEKARAEAREAARKLEAQANAAEVKATMEAAAAEAAAAVKPVVKNTVTVEAALASVKEAEEDKESDDDEERSTTLEAAAAKAAEDAARGRRLAAAAPRPIYDHGPKAAKPPASVAVRKKVKAEAAVEVAAAVEAAPAAAAGPAAPLEAARPAAARSAAARPTDQGKKRESNEDWKQVATQPEALAADEEPAEAGRKRRRKLLNHKQARAEMDLLAGD